MGNEVGNVAVAATWQTGADVAVIVQTVLVAVSVLFVIYQLHDARKVRAETSRPFIVVDLGTQGQRIDLVVRNVGQTSAIDVRVKFDPPPIALSDRFGEVVSMLENEGIPYMAPGRELRFFYSVAGRVFESGFTRRFKASASYGRADQPEGARRIEDPPSIIDLERIRHAQLATPATEKAVDQLKQIAKSMERLARDVHRVLDDRTDPPAL